MLGGGGGNFGVVTALDFSTLDIRGLTFASMAVRWPLRDLATLISGWSAWNADPDTPRELRTAIELLSDAGKPCEVAVTGTFIGSPADLDPHLDRLAAVVGRPESHRMSYPCSYVQAAAEPERWGAGTFGPRVAFAAKSQIVRSPLSPAAAAAMAEAVERVQVIGGVTGASGLLIDSLGGAVADTDPTATAFPHRNAVGVVQYHSYWHQATAEAEIQERIEWLREIHAEMHPHLGAGGYVNGMDPELADWETAYHAENYPRLQRVKAAVDPEQFFTFPQAITPAAKPTDPDAGGAQVRVPPPRRGIAAGAPSGADLEHLARQLHGRLLRPGEREFETARLVHNQRYDTVVPTAIARIADEHDAAACLAFAAEADIPIAIRSGGHSYAGYCTTRGLVIDVASLDAVNIGFGGVGGNRARIGAGASSMAAGRALADRGLAIAAGRWGSVSVAGLTLGGGKSAFTRAWGLSCDRMTGTTIVTTDGRTRQVTDSPDDQDADLYWALRGGGGGNFGVVTALDFAPVDITGQSFAHFQIQWPHEEMMRALQGWQHWIVAPRTPREISCDVRLMLDGTGPARPIVHGAWIGGPAELRRTIEILIAAVGRPPERMAVTPCSYVQAAMVTEHPLHDSSTPSGSAWPTPTYRTETGSGQDGRLAWAGKSHIVRQPLTEAATAILIAGINQLHRLGATGGFYLDSLGGAVAELAPDATAYPHRGALAVLQYITTWPRTCPPWHAAARRESMRATHTAMQAHLGTGAYVNDTDPELLDWEHAYYGENYPRLQRIKAAYDPQQILDFPQAVKPA
jgi:FAD/FMN-containing dehydrogenase